MIFIFQNWFANSAPHYTQDFFESMRHVGSWLMVFSALLFTIMFGFWCALFFGDCANDEQSRYQSFNLQKPEDLINFRLFIILGYNNDPEYHLKEHFYAALECLEDGIAWQAAIQERMSKEEISEILLAQTQHLNNHLDIGK